MNKKILWSISLLAIGSLTYAATSMANINFWNLSSSTSSTSSQSILSWSYKKVKNCNQIEQYLSWVANTQIKSNNSKINNIRWSVLEDRLVGWLAKVSASNSDVWGFWDTNTTSVQVPPSTASAAWETISNSISNTNVQVEGIDEADIVKNDGQNWYYYNSKLWKIIVVSISSGTPTKIGEISTDREGVEMYVKDWRLITIWSKYSYSSSSDSIWSSNPYSTAIKIFDTKNISDIKTISDYEIPWTYQDSRLVWKNLVVTTTKNSYVYVPYNKIQKLYSPAKKDYQLTIKTSTWDKIIGCEDSYLPPIIDEELNRTLITNFDISENNITSTKVIYWNFDTMYMSEKNLYLATSEESYTPSVRFFWKTISESKYSYKTKITNFDLAWNYKNDFLVDWKLSSQYFMDEDENGYLRIATNSWGWGEENYSNIFVTINWKIEGQLNNIAKWENIKAIRFFWDKAFLVTYQQIDPLFVIDLKDTKNPKIIWELKIPGYSSYLHPYWAQVWDIQYLIWLGYDTQDNWYGWEKLEGLKLSLFKIDYWKKENFEAKCWKLIDTKQIEKCRTQVDENNILVEEKSALNLGSYGSKSDAIENPRAFIFDNQTKSLYLPLVLSKEVKWKTCSYFSLDWKPVEDDIFCRDETRNIVDFIGLKGYSIQESWIKETISSPVQKYLKTLIWNNDYYSRSTKWYDDTIYNYSYLRNRVGYQSGYAFFLNDYLINVTNWKDTKNLIFKDESTNKVDESDYILTWTINNSSTVITSSANNFVQWVAVN